MRRHEGELRDGEPNGHGTMTRRGGGRYVDKCRDGKPHGQSVTTVSDGTRRYRNV